MKKKNLRNLILIIILLLSIKLFENKFLNSKELLYNFYSEQFTQEQIEKVINSHQKFEWISYVIPPLIVLIRASLVTICLSVASFFYNMNEVNLPKFKDFFHIALLGEFVLVLVGYFKFGYFYFIKTDFALQDLVEYYPLSYSNYLNLENIEPWLLYPLQTINLFEITYFFVLVYGLHKLLKNKYLKSFEMVVVSYGTGLVIWLGLVMFLTLNIT